MNMRQDRTIETQGLLKSPRFIKSVWIVGGFFGVILIFNIFVIGGKDVYTLITNAAPIFTVLTASYLFSRVLTVEKNSVTRSLWHGLAIGLFFWGVADAIWMVYDVFLHEDVPYPSIADLFWVVGYIPLYAALLIRVQHLGVKITSRQGSILIALTGTWLILALIFVLWPVIISFNSKSLLESALSLAYPLFDLGLMILSTFLLVLVRKGRFALSWRLISAGVFVMGLSDMLYTYTVSIGLYYPDGAVNSLTILVDSTY